MLSAEDIAAVKTAIIICNTPELKKKILCVSGSDYDTNCYKHKKKLWNKIVEKKATIILKNMHLPEALMEKVMGIVFSVGMRMLTWAEYHEGTLGFSREYSIKFLNSSFFTERGIIDNKKAAEELMKDESLNIKQKYKLACLYCFTDYISTLYGQMTKEDKEAFYDVERLQRIKQPKLVKLWSYLMDDMDKLEENLDQLLEKAVKDGSKAAVEYCLERTNLRNKKNAIIDASVGAVICRLRAVYTENDRIVFQNLRYKDSEESWVPSDYYVDILFFLFSKMGEDQQIEFLKHDIKGFTYDGEFYENKSRSRVLQCFLNWPYQDYFMKTAGLMWEFLPERDYAVLLLKICDKIKPKDEEDLKYGEERSYDYKELFTKFWCQSPERYKSYTFSNQKVDFRIPRMVTTVVGVELLTRLLTMKTFTNEDIKLILNSAPSKEKENILSSEEWRDVCIEQMKEEKWEMLDRFVRIRFLSKEEGDKFKRELSFTKEAQLVCIDFIRNDNWDAAELFIKWSSLPEEEINQLKKEMIYSEEWRDVCIEQMKEEKWEMLNRFVLFCFLSKEEEDKFKRELSFTKVAQRVCIDFVKNDKWNAAESFIKWSSLPEEEINQLKKEMIYSEYGRKACLDLISPDKKVKAVDKFIRWCFSSEEVVTAFKKELVFSGQGIGKCIELITGDQLELLNIFFNFCLSSEEEIRELKKKVDDRRVW